MTYRYNIADWIVELIFTAEDELTGSHLIPSYAPFAVDDGVGAQPLFTFTVDDTLRPVPQSECQRIRIFDTGNGDTVVDRLTDGGYQYVIRDVMGNDCAMLIADASFRNCRCALAGNHSMRSFGINNALMLAYAFAGSYRDTLLIHASLVRHDGYAYAFIAKSGTGKSTQVANWLRTIPNCDLMNDDNPVVRVFHDDACEGPDRTKATSVVIYGSPWSGKTPCYRRVSAPLAAVTRIERAEENSIRRLQPIEAFGSFLPSCSAMKWERGLYSRICDAVTDVVSNIPIYTLRCTADPESAIVCSKAVSHG